MVHGPVPRDYTQRTPKKMKAAALRGALSDRARGGNLHVLASLPVEQTPSTKKALGALRTVSTARKILVVLPFGDQIGWRSLRNVPEVHLLWAGQLNTYDVLNSDDVVFTRAALDEFLAASGRTVEFAAAGGGRHAAAEESTVAAVAIDAADADEEQEEEK